MEEERGLGDERQQQQQAAPPQTGGAVTATLTQPGSLGLKLSPVDAQTQMGMKILAVNPGTEAEQHPQLRGGL
eukprot:SAG22_NODE_20252_length_267_cov_0.619048_1_plen_72_part_01